MHRLIVTCAQLLVKFRPSLVTSQNFWVRFPLDRLPTLDPAVSKCPATPMIQNTRTGHVKNLMRLNKGEAGFLQQKNVRMQMRSSQRLQTLWNNYRQKYANRTSHSLSCSSPMSCK